MMFMALEKDFWSAWGTFSDAKHQVDEMKKIVLEHARYAPAYASAMRVLQEAETDLGEIVNNLKLNGDFTIDMEAMLNPQPLNLIHSDFNAILDFWESACHDDKVVFLMKLGIRRTLALQFADYAYANLPNGFREKMEAVHQ